MTLIRCLRVEIVGIGSDVVCGPYVSEPCFCVLCMLKIRCTGHCSKFCGWILALISKIYHMIAINSIVPHLPTDLTSRPLSFALYSRLKLLLLLRLRLSEVGIVGSW